MKKSYAMSLPNCLQFILAVVILFSGHFIELSAQTLRNCSEIHFYNTNAPSGVYKIDPDGNGPAPAMDCQCDMTTDGGGWTLILNYNHLSDTDPALKVFTDSLPLQGQTTFGFDESQTIYWGHAGNALMNAIPFDEVRFYGITSSHDRVINFKTSHPGTVAYFKTGTGSTEGIKTDFSPLAGHTANLPAAIDHTVYNMGDYAMTAYPLWTGSTYHWYLGGVDPVCIHRWEVDDYPCNTPSTFHQIWVRQNDFLGLNPVKKSGIEIKLSPNPVTDNTELTINSMTPGEFILTQVNVYNLLGTLVFPVITRNEASFTISKGVLSPGVYFCKLVTKSGVLSVTKMVVN